jgi:hypothetical protein
MAGFDYSRMQGTASRLMQRFKQGTIVLTRPGTETPGPNPWDPPVVGDPVEHELDGVAKGVSAEFVDGTTILATDIQITCSVPPVVPSIETDAMTVDGKSVTLLRIDQIPAAGTPVAYRLFVRA